MTPEEQAAADAAAALATQAAIDKAASDKAAADKAAADAAALEAGKSPEQKAAENEANKFRRLHEKADADLKAATAKLKQIDDANLSETERLKKDAEEAKADAKAVRTENLRLKVASEMGIPGDAMEFLTGETEDALRAQAEKLSKMVKTTPIAAGTTTNPGGHQTASIDEKINAAIKSGNTLESIRLKRERAGFNL